MPKLMPLGGLGLLMLPALAAHAAEQGPFGVSPGSPSGVATIGHPCPTFSWTGHQGSTGSVLSIRRVDEEGLVPGPRRRVEIPGDARSWTPSAGDCLVPGETYAWRVRVGESWSDPLLLRVAGGEWVDELLEELIFELLGRRQPTGSAQHLRDATPHENSPLEEPGPALHALGNVSLHADTSDFFGVWAHGEEAGIFATASEVGGRGVYGTVTGGSGTVAGVTGITDSATGIGVFGFGETHGVQGISNEPAGIGVRGLHSGSYATSLQSSGCGVAATAGSDMGRGLTGLATATSGTNYGVYGASSSMVGFDFFSAGTGTDYGPFTGAHEVRLEGDLTRVLPGMVFSATGRTETRRTSGGSIDLSSTMPTARLSDRPHDPAVLGAFVAEMSLAEDHWLEDRSGRFAIVNALGEGRVWVTDVGGPVAVGDYLTTSMIPGFAQRQGDTIQRAHTLGKATEEVDWGAVSETVEHEGRTYRAVLIGVIYTSG